MAEKTLSEKVQEVMSSRFSLNQPIEEDICNFDIFIKDEYFPVGSEGCIGLWTGRQKSRKTFALNCTIASAIKGTEVGPFRYKPNGGIIIHFDTEQPKNRYKIGQRNLYRVGGMDLNTDADRYFSYNLRRFGWSDRTEIINQIVRHFVREKTKIDLICIDGIVDLCEDYNSNATAAATSQSIMTWGDMSGASIYNVLHTTKTSGEVRGHLGTELSNKTDFTVEVRKKNDDDVYSTVRCKDSRYFPFPSFDLYQSRDGLIDLEQGGWRKDEGLDLITEGASQDLPF